MAMAPAARQVSSSAPPSFRAKKKVGVESPHETRPPAGPKPQNNGQMTGPSMQKGAGQGSMFANGRQGQGTPPRSPDMGAPGPGPRRVQGQPGGAPPMTPNNPQGRMGPSRPSGQMQGGHPRGVPTSTHMMADGDPGASPFADTPPIGGMPEDQGDAQGGAPAGDSSAPPPQAGGAMGGDMPVIKPEAVAYHDDPHSCKGCMYFGQDGNCAVLQMQVSPEGGCNAFEAGAGGGEPDADDMNDPSAGFGGGGGTGAGFTQNPSGTSGSPSLS